MAGARLRAREARACSCCGRRHVDDMKRPHTSRRGAGNELWGKIVKVVLFVPFLLLKITWFLVKVIVCLVALAGCIVWATIKAIFRRLSMLFSPWQRRYSQEELEEIEDQARDHLESEHELFPSFFDRLPGIVSDLFSSDPVLQLAAVLDLEETLSADNCAAAAFEDMVAHAIDAGAVTRICKILTSTTIPALQASAAEVLTVMATEASALMKPYVDSIVPAFVQLTWSRETRVVELGLESIASLAECVAFRDMVIKHSTVRLATRKLSESDRDGKNTVSRRNAALALRNLADGPPSNEQVAAMKKALSVLVQTLTDADAVLVRRVSTAIACMARGPPAQIQSVVDSGACAKLVDLLKKPETSLGVQTAALRAVGNICAGGQKHAQVMIDCGVLPCLAKLLVHTHKGLQEDACWAVGHITAGLSSQIQTVIDAGILPLVIQLMSLVDPAMRQYATVEFATVVVSNISLYGTPQQVLYMVGQNCLEALGRLRNDRDASTARLARGAIQNISKTLGWPASFTRSLQIPSRGQAADKAKQEAAKQEAAKKAAAPAGPTVSALKPVPPKNKPSEPKRQPEPPKEVPKEQKEKPKGKEAATPQAAASAQAAAASPAEGKGKEQHKAPSTPASPQAGGRGGGGGGGAGASTAPILEEVVCGLPACKEASRAIRADEPWADVRCSKRCRTATHKSCWRNHCRVFGLRTGGAGGRCPVPKCPGRIQSAHVTTGPPPETSESEEDGPEEEEEEEATGSDRGANRAGSGSRGSTPPRERRAASPSFRQTQARLFEPERRERPTAAATATETVPEFSCPLCDITVNSQSQLDKHKQGRKHKHMEAMASNPPPAIPLPPSRSRRPSRRSRRRPPRPAPAFAVAGAPPPASRGRLARAPPAAPAWGAGSAGVRGAAAPAAASAAPAVAGRTGVSPPALTPLISAGGRSARSPDRGRRGRRLCRGGRHRRRAPRDGGGERRPAARVPLSSAVPAAGAAPSSSRSLPSPPPPLPAAPALAPRAGSSAGASSLAAAASGSGLAAPLRPTAAGQALHTLSQAAAAQQQQQQQQQQQAAQALAAAGPMGGVAGTSSALATEDPIVYSTARKAVAGADVAPAPAAAGPGPAARPAAARPRRRAPRGERGGRGGRLAGAGRALGLAGGLGGGARRPAGTIGSAAPARRDPWFHFGFGSSMSVFNFSLFGNEAPQPQPQPQPLPPTHHVAHTHVPARVSAAASVAATAPAAARARAWAPPGAPARTLARPGAPRAPDPGEEEEDALAGRRGRVHAPDCEAFEGQDGEQSSPPASPTVSIGGYSASDMKTDCLICCANPSNAVILECGHACLCMGCASSGLSSCPICREPISRVVRVYRS
eukprot:tig00020830_g14499.t1